MKVDGGKIKTFESCKPHMVVCAGKNDDDVQTGDGDSTMTIVLVVAIAAAVVLVVVALFCCWYCKRQQRIRVSDVVLVLAKKRKISFKIKRF